ncbi:MAG TPA: serine/threonine-protein kinase, partial [Polyangia bacterium]|nr:serine/threonine-protein kinase [Polyangia bacterium]
MTSDPSDPFAGEIVDERWKIGDKLGSGGMGVVYRAERVKLGRAVAIKFLDERAVHSKDAVARFEREARATSRLTHRHCVSILDFGVWRHRPYIVMEFVDGRPLNQEMGRPSMTPSRAIGIMRQILEALRHAHASGVVHRDLKPENVMLTEATGNEDFVKLLDFGLAKIIAVDEPTISHPRMIAGTPSYMSPEQARGEKADHRTDIYSAGVILYGMCTGQKPFRAEDQVALLRMHMSVPPPSPRKVAPEKHISPELERVILKALEKDRNARYYHAGEFLTALEATPEARGLVVRGRRRRRALGAAAALTLVAVAAGGAWRWQTRLHERLEATRRLWQPAPPHGATTTAPATAAATPTATAPSEATVDLATTPSATAAPPATASTAATASASATAA